MLRQIDSRVKLAVRTATGTETTTRGKGDLVIHGCIQDGTVKKLEGTGTGHFLPELTHSLLSVSHLCSNGCTQDDQDETRAKQTVGYLKQAHKLATKEYLFLMDRLKLNSAPTVVYALAMKTELSTVKRRKKQLSKLRESEDEDQSSYWNQSSKSGKRPVSYTHLTLPSTPYV